LADLDQGDRFDTILYMDVLEHIDDDRAELARAAEKLQEGGCLIVLAPAHLWLFTAFDEGIGHFRRYTKHTLKAVAPDGLALARLAYLDSIGMLASLGNKFVLKSAMPSPGQIAVWDRLMVPLSRLVDPFFGYSLGKSVLAVWRKPNRNDRRRSDSRD
jgi:SAM-dependent methyltransferase